MEKKNKEFNLEMIGEIQKNISEALKQWSDIMLTADADQWAYYLDYDDEDMLNALLIFMHVWQNNAIKRQVIDGDNAAEKMEKFRDMVKECYGIDTLELSEKVIEKKQKNE